MYNMVIIAVLVGLVINFAILISVATARFCKEESKVDPTPEPTPEPEPVIEATLSIDPETSSITVTPEVENKPSTSKPPRKNNRRKAKFK